MQVAKQQGQYLAQLVKAGIEPGKLPEGVAPFKYNHKGSLAYVGAHPCVDRQNECVSASQAGALRYSC